MSLIILDLATAIIIATTLAILGYLKVKPTGENFSIEKFATRILYGIIVGVIVYISGQTINEDTITTALLANAGLLVIVEYVIKIIISYLKMIYKSYMQIDIFRQIDK